MAPASPLRGGALVTGAGKRLGRAIACALGRAGFFVAVHYGRSADSAAETVARIEQAGGRAAALTADLSREDETQTLIARAMERVGPLAVLVNSASVFEEDDVAGMTRASWDLHMETNLRAPAVLAQQFALEKGPGGDRAIINLIDQRVLKPTPQFLSYTLSKNALYALTRTLAQALGPAGIRVNGVGPGPTLKNARQSEEDFRRQQQATVLGRGATPDDIAGAVLYLVDAAAVTGQMIAVDGGQHLIWRTPDALVRE